ncbi:MAG: FAD-dependent oxidoreductase [Elainellaceae cyanobacterium]
MAVDYNLVILGGSLVAHHAAVRAAEWGARVALVEPPRSPADWEREQLQLAYLQAGQEPWDSTRPSDRQTMTMGSRVLPLDWDGKIGHRLAEANTFAAWQLDQSDPASLAFKGIDVVTGSGAFVDGPTLAVQVGERVLRGHHYLIAGAAVPHIPPALEQSHITSLQHLGQVQPQSVAVWGEHPQTLVLAQALQRLGLLVVLATPANRLLPQEDLEVVNLIQAQLEADGVSVITSASLADAGAQRGEAPDSIEIRSGSLILRVDRVMSPSTYAPNFSTLVLPAAIKTTPSAVIVNRQLQTGHPRIYACGYTLDANCTTAVAIAEAEVAVDNALSLPYRHVPYTRIPQTLLTDPPAVRIGLTARQALQRHRGAVVLRQILAPLKRTQLEGSPPGLCQLVVSKQGRILGACAIGPAAQEWCSLLVWAIARRMTLQSLNLTWPGSAYGEVILSLANQWRWQRRRWLVKRLEPLWNWRRDWTR